jgi:2Fe-2S ferredoxin
MPKITFIEFDTTEHEVEIEAGLSLMEGALDNLINGIVAECGGCCVCCTCHCIIDPEWVHATGQANPQEDELLDMVDSRQPTSRLSCQIKVTEEMDGLVVRLPASQF